ncbi:MAG: 3-isopropylmalate dehydratase large subunit [Chlamydiae bacterium]|nr:3-isopropylmalate dehydratase large subunit [Chlamydiota bacterium]
MQQNIIEKIWNTHVVERRKGFPDILAIDLHLVHEVTSPQAFQMLREKKLPVFSTKQTLATIDHNVSTTPNRENLPNPISRKQILALRENAREFNVRLFDMGSGKQGIVHMIGPECGVTLPGSTIVCGDSHTSTHGAFGALAFGIGTSEVGYVLATGCILHSPSETMRVHFKGQKEAGITAKDLILKLIQHIGVSGGRGYTIEYTGEAIEALTMEERMTICNMSIECGARAGLIAPDEITYEYLKHTDAAPKGNKWEEALKYFKSVRSDPGAHFDREVEVDITDLAPMVTWGTNPGQSSTIEGKVPLIAELHSKERALAQRAMEYMGVEPGLPLLNLPIDYVFIGSCTNARISDLRAAAEIMRGKKVAKDVVVYVVPGSENVHHQAEKEGLIEIFVQAGAEFRHPGCSSCLAMNEDKIPPKARCASTSNRNFIGRQGPGARTHLMSPIMAAAAAIAGKIVDVRGVLI